MRSPPVVGHTTVDFIEMTHSQRMSSQPHMSDGWFYNCLLSFSKDKDVVSCGYRFRSNLDVRVFCDMLLALVMVNGSESDVQSFGHFT